jgi:hypothetical protein
MVERKAVTKQIAKRYVRASKIGKGQMRLRFLGWATYKEAETEIVVTAESPGADPLLLGSWPRSLWLEYVRRF